MSQSNVSSNLGPHASENFIVSTGGQETFVDRRTSGSEPVRGERRQFGSSHIGLSDDGRELALAIDQYKVEHHRRYITCDEMLAVIKSLGYKK